MSENMNVDRRTYQSSSLKSRLRQIITSTTTIRCSDRFRAEFNSLPIPRVKATPGHSHGEAAAVRSAAAVYAETFAQLVGRVPYFLSLSSNDVKRNNPGSHLLEAGKDLALAYRNDAIESSHIVVMVDCDYYIDMPDFLLQHDNTVVLYTTTPESVGDSEGNSSHYFRNNVYHEIVAGGGRYSHQLWDYGHDHITVCGFKGMTVVRKMYKIERRKVARNRSLVLLQLTAVTSCCGVYFGTKIRPNPLRTLRPEIATENGFYNILRVVHKDKLCISVSRSGGCTSATVHVSDYDHLLSIKANVKNITKATVESYITQDGARGAAAILHDFLNATANPPSQYMIINDLGISSYQFVREVIDFDSDAKPCLEAFMSPFVGPAIAPENTVNNDLRCAEQRVVAVQHTKPLNVTKFTMQCITEAVQFLVKDVGHRIAPVSFNEVFVRQPKPTQQRILLDADALGPRERRDVIQSFMKSEAYGKYTDPRNISTLPGSIKYRYARYVYAITDAVKGKWKWYAFGKTPKQIANQVAGIASRAKSHIVIGDLSRMDGNRSNVGRLFVKTLYMSLFYEHYLDELNELMNRQIFCKAFTKHGVQYNTMYSMLSGAGDTSFSNSLECFFKSYLGFRYAGFEPLHAYRNSSDNCVFGGDDSAEGDADPQCVVRAAKTLGHTQTNDVIMRGDRGVNFLSRYYSPMVWYGDPQSMCDFKRQILKFHSTPRRGVDYSVEINCLKKLQEKALSFALTDRHTPIIGQFCVTVLQMCNTDVDVLMAQAKFGDRWWSRFEESEQFPQAPNADWMLDEITQQLPELDFKTFDEWISKVTKPSELLSPPLLLHEPYIMPMPSNAADQHGFGTGKDKAPTTNRDGVPLDKAVKHPKDKNKKKRDRKNKQRVHSKERPQQKTKLDKTTLKTPPVEVKPINPTPQPIKPASPKVGPMSNKHRSTTPSSTSTSTSTRRNRRRKTKKQRVREEEVNKVVEGLSKLDLDSEDNSEEKYQPESPSTPKSDDTPISGCSVHSYGYYQALYQDELEVRQKEPETVFTFPPKDTPKPHADIEEITGILSELVLDDKERAAAEGCNEKPPTPKPTRKNRRRRKAGKERNRNVSAHSKGPS